MANREEVRRLGLGDTAVIWDKIASTDLFFRKLILENLDVWPFTELGWASTIRAPESAQTLCILRCLNARRPITHSYNILAAGEIIAPAVNSNYIVTKITARAEFITVMKWAIRNMGGSLVQYFRESPDSRTSFHADLVLFFQSVPIGTPARAQITSVLSVGNDTDAITETQALNNADHPIEYYMYVLL